MSSWENDENAPTVDNIIYLSETFHVSTDYLLIGLTDTADKTRVKTGPPKMEDIFLDLFNSFNPAKRDEVIKFMRYQEFLSKGKP